MDRSIDLAVQLMDKKKNKMWTNNNKLWTNNNKLWIRNNNKLWIRNYNKLWTNPSADNCVQLLIFFFSLLQQCRSLLLSFILIAKYAVLSRGKFCWKFMLFWGEKFSGLKCGSVKKRLIWGVHMGCFLWLGPP